MKAFNKDIVRSIRHSLGRFVAIAAIVALGCGFYAGLRMTAPDMKLAADAYYDGTDLMDIRVVSTLGLTDEDIEALRDVPGVSGVEAAYSADVLATLNDEQYVMRVHSLSPSAATAVKTDAGAISSDDANYLNRLDLVEGRWPTSANECVIFNDRVMSGPSSLGDTVTVDPSVGNVQDTLAETEFTVVGRVHSPLYVSSTSMGTSTIGSGTIEQFMYVLPEAFDADMPYVEAYVSVEGAAELPADSDAYDDRVAGVVAAIEGIAPAREQARVDGLKAEAQADLDEARAEYEEEEARAKTELADARGDSRYVFVSIPYSSGWSATMDGNPIEIQKANIGFMVVEVDGAEHDVYFSYVTPGLLFGALCSGIGLVAIVAFELLWFRSGRRKRRSADKE